MKFKKLALLAAVCAGTSAGAAEGRTALYAALGSQTGQVAPGDWKEPACGCGEAVCGCEAMQAPTCGCEGTCDGGCDGGCDSLGASSSGGGCPLGFGGLGDCNLGDPYTLFGNSGPFSAGGWVQLGYHDENVPLFNQHRGNLNLHQAWLFAERAIDTRYGFDIGGRIDYVYGVDAPDTQALRSGRVNAPNNSDSWDSDWDHGIYGHALPQLYGEVGYGDLAVKVGHFYTTIGWESVSAPDNFFYSHTYTMYRSEPFTHTGALATYSGFEDVTFYGGYTLGWDSGFDDNGDNFLGGVSVDLSDDVNIAYQTTIGRFGEARFTGVEKGYMHSFVINAALSDRLQYVYQNDYLDTENAAGNTVRRTFGINQYMIYTINDCLSLGSRSEWYNSQGVFAPPQVAGQEDDIYAWTVGANYRPHANVILRPEIRTDWDPAEIAGLTDGDQQTTFGFDMIYLF